MGGLPSAALAGVLAGLAAYLLCGSAVGRLSGPRRPGRPRELAALLADLPLVRGLRRSEERSRTRTACLTELPALIDVVTLGLSAGLSFDSSLELYCARNASPLARAFSGAMLSWRMGATGRAEALEGLSGELGVPALGQFAAVVEESLAFGTPLAEVLERQAQAMREEQRSQVEEEIERIPVKMLVPMGTLIVPAMFLAILGPLLGSALVIG